MSRSRGRWIRWGVLGVATSLACGSSDEAGLGTTTTSPQGQAGASGAGGGASAGTAGVAGGIGGQAGAVGGTAGSAGGAVTGGSAGKGGAGAIGGSAGQAGGAGATGGSAGKAAAGAAGAPPACTIPALVQGPVGVQSISDTRMEQWPSLQMTSDAGVPAALSFHWTSWPGGTVTGIRTLPLAQPFAPWPDGPVGPSFESTPLMLDGPVVAQTGASDGLAMLFLAFGASGQRHVGFTRNHSAAGGAMTSIDASPPVAPDITLRPLFVTRGNGASAGDFLVGFERGPEGFYTADVALVDAAGGVAKQPTFGCATAAIEMDAMPTATPSVFRVVGASGKDCCSCSSGAAPGAPTLLMTTRVGAVTETASVVSAGALPIRAVKLVPRSDGAWLVVARAASDTQPTTVELGRADGQGIVAAPAPLFDAMAGRTLSAARYQDGLVVGWIEPDGAASKLEIRLVSAAGNVTAASSSPLPHAVGTSPISLLANPSGGGLVVAWSHPTVPPIPDSRIAMARLSWGCMK